MCVCVCMQACMHACREGWMDGMCVLQALMRRIPHGRVKCCSMFLRSFIQTDGRHVVYCQPSEQSFSAGGTWGKDGSGANEDTHPDL